MKEDIDSVKDFWNANPLWTGESQYEVGTLQFFEEHRATKLNDCYAGRFDYRILPPSRENGQDMKILDLGCGVGYWTTEFTIRGLHNIVAADITSNALAITEQRLRMYGAQAELKEENAESLSFADETFDHVNCQGVIHHTPNTEQCVSEIARVLKMEGTASLSVYYRNAALKLWPYLFWLGRVISFCGGSLRGRGRENIFRVRDIDEIVRFYDGAMNPIGKCYSRKQFEAMLTPHFTIEEIYFHFSPARALPFRIPQTLHRWLDKNIPFLIYANVKKRCVE